MGETGEGDSDQEPLEQERQESSPASPPLRVISFATWAERYRAARASQNPESASQSQPQANGLGFQHQEGESDIHRQRMLNELEARNEQRTQNNTQEQHNTQAEINTRAEHNTQAENNTQAGHNTQAQHGPQGQGQPGTTQARQSQQNPRSSSQFAAQGRQDPYNAFW